MFANCLRALMASTILMYSCLVEPIEFSYSQADFYDELQQYKKVTFSETPSFLAEAVEPGGDGGSTYYQIIAIDDITFYRVNWNQNKPGMRRLTDVGNEGTYDFYRAARGGNFLIPGLGDKQNDDGVLVSFEDVDDPVTAFGIVWGSVQETSECCIVQWFDFEFADGTIESVVFDSANQYHGRGTESSSTTFLGFKSPKKKIRSVKINQFGHNPIADDIVIGAVVESVIPDERKPRHTMTTVEDFGPPEPDPMRNITVEAEETPDELQALENLKQHYVEWAQNATDLSEVAAGIESIPGVPPEVSFYLYHLKRFLSIDASIYSDYANDPPKNDYDVIEPYPGRDFTEDFEEIYGEDYAVFDQLFYQWHYAIENLQAGFPTMERLQGAYLDAAEEAFHAQAEHLGMLWTESDKARAIAFTLFDGVIDILSDNSRFNQSDPGVSDTIDLSIELKNAVSDMTVSRTFGDANDACDYDRDGDYDIRDLISQLQDCLRSGSGGCFRLLIDSIKACGVPQ